MAFVDDYLPALLTRANELVSGGLQRMLDAHGLTMTEWRMLAALASGEPMSVGRLAEISAMKQPTVTRLLDRMEERGHVHRVGSAGDRRVTLVRATPAGTQLAARLIPLALAHERRVLDSLGSEQAARLKAALQQLIALHQAAAPDDPGDE